MASSIDSIYLDFQRNCKSLSPLSLRAIAYSHIFEVAALNGTLSFPRAYRIFQKLALNVDTFREVDFPRLLFYADCELKQVRAKSGFTQDLRFDRIKRDALQAYVELLVGDRIDEHHYYNMLGLTSYLSSKWIQPRLCQAFPLPGIKIFKDRLVISQPQRKDTYEFLFSILPLKRIFLEVKGLLKIPDFLNLCNVALNLKSPLGKDLEYLEQAWKKQMDTVCSITLTNRQVTAESQLAERLKDLIFHIKRMEALSHVKVVFPLLHAPKLISALLKRTLTVLDLNMQVGDWDVAKVALVCHKLETLVLRFSPGVSKAGLVQLTTLKHLETLYLSHLEKLPVFKALRTLGVGTPITDEQLDQIIALPVLQKLKVDVSLLDDEAFRKLGMMRYLTHLTVLKAVHFYEVYLTVMDSLRSLTITDCPNLGLARLPPLQELTLRNCQIRCDHFNTHKLRLVRCAVPHAFFDKTTQSHLHLENLDNIPDDWAKRLAANSNLRTLVIRKMKFKLEELINSRVEHLTLGNIEVTEEEVEKFLRSSFFIEKVVFQKCPEITKQVLDRLRVKFPYIRLL